MTALPQDEGLLLAEFYSAKRGSKAQLEWDFAWNWLQLGYSSPVMFREYRFHPSRRWRFDFALPGLMIAVEVEGGEFSRGRHVRPTGFIKDAEKYNAAALLGWQVLRFPGSVITKDCAGAVATVKAAIRRRKRQRWPGLRHELRCTNSPIKVRR